MSEFLYFGDDLSVYKEIPVNIDTFIEDPYFIGKYTDNGKRIYPFWRNALRKVFSSENTTRNVIVSTAIGTGKTRFCHIATAYSLYLFHQNDSFFQNSVQIYAQFCKSEHISPFY